ncbi:ABC transporter ATP-binding protein [Natronospora cellulosivora (SeqCode)]
MFKLTLALKEYKITITAIVFLFFVQTIAQLYLPTLLADIVDIGIVNGDISFIMRLGVLMLFLALFATFCTVFANYLAAKTATSFSRKLRSKLFRRGTAFSLYEFDQIGTASLITRNTNDIEQIQRVTSMALRLLISAPLMAIGGIIMAVSKDPQLSLIIIFVVPVLAGLVILISRKAIPLFKKLQKKIDKLNLVLREILTGIRVVRAFNQIDYERERFKGANSDLTETAVKVHRIMSMVMPLMFFLLNITIVFVIYFASFRIDAGVLQVGDLMAFIQYIMYILFALLMVSMMLIMIPRASASAERINEVLDMKTEIIDPVKPKVSTAKKGYIEFDNVSFRYHGAEEPALEDISFRAKPGEVTAIIGGTGSGKSTLINLIPRFYDIEKGRILIDDIDIRDLKQKDLRSKIAFVPQKAVLFTGTIFENIVYGKEDANLEEVKKAARIAQATAFINEDEDAYQAMVSQGGSNFSGGQKQRLAIARALIRKPEIFVFDDSFSALDFKTESKLRSALNEEIKDSSVLIVAQRVSSIMNADQIIVLEKGQVLGIGKHQDLLENCQVYQEIVKSQLNEEEL